MTTAHRAIACAFMLGLALFALGRWQTDPRTRTEEEVATTAAARGGHSSETSSTREPAAPRARNPQARAVIDASIERATQALASEPIQAKYLACEQATPGAAACLELRDAALFAVASRELEPVAFAEAKRMLDVCGGNVVCARAPLVDVLLEERGPAATISAAGLMLALDQENPTIFPPQLYADLGRRTDPEVQLILNAHLAAPLPSAEIARDVMALALDPATTPRVRLSAVQALGHQAHLEALRPIVAAARRGEPQTEVLSFEVLPRALGRCGEPCQPELDALAADARPAARAIAYRALNLMNESQSEALRGRWLQAASDESRAAAEMAAAEAPFENTGG